KSLIRAWLAINNSPEKVSVCRSGRDLSIQKKHLPCPEPFFSFAFRENQGTPHTGERCSSAAVSNFNNI
ncbi:MAG: hypothetical protein PUK52_00860, partial [Desulfovibrio sp.]|nr:hypothetical protein [Desulfovibrio sp.]